MCIRDRLYSTANKKIPGKFSDETPGRFIHVALDTKVYSYTTVSSIRSVEMDTVKKIRGVKYSAQESLNFDDFKRALLSQTTQTVIQHSLQSYNLEMYTIEQRRAALPSNYNERYVCPDGISTIS